MSIIGEEHFKIILVDELSTRFQVLLEYEIIWTLLIASIKRENISLQELV